MAQFINRDVFINATLFQILWFAAIMGSAKLVLWPAIIACVALAIWQLNPSRKHASDLKLIAISICMGLVIDTVFLQLNLFTFTYSFPLEGVSPAWIILLWVGFALTINHSMKWLELHPLLPAAMGAIFAPLSYLAGLRLGAVEYHADSVLISALISVAWAIALTVLVRIASNNKQSHA